MHVLAFLSYVVVTTFTPGPNNIMSMTNSQEHGLQKTMKFTFGVASGFAVLLLLCSYFNLVLVKLLPKVEFAMSIIGAAYMVYLAVKIVSKKSGSSRNRGDRAVSFSTGLLLQFVNPKAILYAITVISTFVIPYYKSLLSLTLFSLFLAFVSLLSTSSWAAFGSVFHVFIRKYTVPFNVVMALLLVYCAVSLFA